MWSPTRAIAASNGRLPASRACLRASGGKDAAHSLQSISLAEGSLYPSCSPAAGYRRIFTGMLVLLLCLTFSGCGGYRFAAESESVIGDGTKTLKVKGVDYPTLHPWLPHAIRSSLRDEIGARYLAKWVDSGQADYEIQINVIRYTSRQWIRTEQDTTQLYSIDLALEGIIYDGSTNKEVWRSGIVSYAEQQEQADELAASGDLLTQVMRRLTDKMRNTF